MVPGLPVYLTGGIILTDKPFVKAFGGDDAYPGSYILAITVAIFTCFFVKLFAVVCQQKVGLSSCNRRLVNTPV